MVNLLCDGFSFFLCNGWPRRAFGIHLVVMYAASRSVFGSLPDSQWMRLVKTSSE